MYAGNIVEIGPVDEVFYHPRHAYTLSLLNAAPRLSHTKIELESIPGNPPDLIQPPSGCKFHPRCPFATEICTTTPPPLESQQSDYAASHEVACHHSDAVIQAVRNA
jgi:oligopeptide/dipeptide ABC transporter ATP-binding protein